MNILKVSLLSFAMFFVIGTVVAQNEAPEMVRIDEDIQAQELEVGEPTILPDSPFYFFKEWGRTIQSFFAFNPIAKAELLERFANEKLIELKKMVEQEKSRERIEKAIKNYQFEIKQAERAAERIKERAEDNKEVENFLDKFIRHQILHQRILQKLEEQVPPEIFEKIKETREMHLEKFGEVMNKLQENKEQLQERLEKNLQEIPGSEFKEFKNLEILKELEEKVPEEAKEAIRRAQENSLLRLKEKLEQMSSETQEKFQEYIEKIGGEKERHIEILEKLEAELQEMPEAKEGLIQTRNRILEKVKERVK